jgi:hypothetical protein
MYRIREVRKLTAIAALAGMLLSPGHQANAADRPGSQPPPPIPKPNYYPPKPPDPKVVPQIPTPAPNPPPKCYGPACRGGMPIPRT